MMTLLNRNKLIALHKYLYEYNEARTSFVVFCVIKIDFRHSIYLFLAPKSVVPFYCIYFWIFTLTDTSVNNLLFVLHSFICLMINNLYTSGWLCLEFCGWIILARNKKLNWIELFGFRFIVHFILVLFWI